jgi:hypothetical protein
MITQNRAAEYGGEIIADTDLHTFTRKVTHAVCLIQTVVAAITCDTDRPVAGIDWYVGKTLAAGHRIEANLKTLDLTSGAIQVYYMP